MPYPSGQLRLKATAFLLLSHNAWLRVKIGISGAARLCSRTSNGSGICLTGALPPACPAGAGVQLNSSDKDRNPNFSQHCPLQQLVIPSTPAANPNSPWRRQVGVTPAQQGCPNTWSANILLSLKLAPLSNFNGLLSIQNILQLSCNWEDWRKKERAWILLPVPSSIC